MAAVLLATGPISVGAEALDRFDVERAAHATAYAVRLAPAPAAKGKAYRFELRAGDCAKPADCSSRRERAELSEGWRASSGTEVRYRIKLFLPRSYPELSPKQILGQWHDGDNPVLSNRYEREHFWVDLMTKSGRTTSRFPLAGFAKGKWHWLTYQVLWRPDPAGRLRVWHGDRLVVDHHGPTLISGTREGPRFKFGIYRSGTDASTDHAPTQVVYFDEYSRNIIHQPKENKSNEKPTY